MPYIPQVQRVEIDPLVHELAETILFPLDGDSKGKLVENEKLDGRVNYAITTLLLHVYPERKYYVMNRMLGVLEAVKQEMYRRHIAKYEDECITRNGDIFIIR